MSSPPHDDDDLCPLPAYSEVLLDPAPAFTIRASINVKRTPTSLLAVAPRRKRPPPSYESAAAAAAAAATAATTTAAAAVTVAVTTPDERNNTWLRRICGPSTKPPPKPEGVPLELVVDRFGNRTRKLKVRSMSDRIRQRAREGTTFQVGSYYLSKM